MKQLKHCKVPTTRATETREQRRIRFHLRTTVYPSRIGLLSKITNPDGTHVYQPTVPASELPSRRHTQAPIPGFTTEGLSFLRFQRSQPVLLSRSLTSKRAVLVRQEELFRALDTDMLLAAAEEDHWDTLIDAQFRREGRPNVTGDSSYRSSIMVSKLWAKWRRERNSADMEARAVALQSLADEHARLLDESNLPGDSSRAVICKSDKKPAQLQSKLVIVKPDSVRPLTIGLLRKQGRLPPAQMTDPFAHPSWCAIVNSQGARMKRWLAEDSP